jgi:hypothetical protein
MVKKTYRKEYFRNYNKEYKKSDRYKKRRKQLLTKYRCDCGGKYDSEHKNWHMKSKRHQRYEAMKVKLEDFEVPNFEDLDTYNHEIFNRSIPFNLSKL